MKLKHVQVTEYKSIRDSTEFETTDITCLVGKNESGKTALLEAIYRLNPIVEEDADFNVTDHYPRVDVEDYQQAVEAEERVHAEIIRAAFELEDDDVKSLTAELGSDCLKDRTVVLSKGYKNVLYVNLPTDETAVVATLVGAAGLPKDIEREAKNQETVEDLLSYLVEQAAEQKKAHMFEPDFYLGLVSGEYGIAPPLTASSLPQDDRRILVRLEEYFKHNPLPQGSFNHYRPARYFAENIQSLKPNLVRATLDRFQQTFDAVNALLG